MPAIVQKSASPDPIATLAGAAQGFAQGQQIQLEVNQRNADRQQAQLNADRQREDQLAQFNQEMDFRLRTLEDAKREGKLNREQESKLEVLKQVATGIRQRADQRFEGSQNELERKKEVLIARERNAVDYKNIDETRKRSLRDFALAKEQLRSQASEMNRVGSVLQKYGKPGSPTWNEEQAFNEYILTTETPGSTTGAEGVPQMTPEERAVKKEAFLKLASNYDKEFERLVGETEKMTVAQGAKKVGATSSYGEEALPLSSMMDPKDIDPISKSPRIKVTGTPLQQYTENVNDLEGDMLSMSIALGKAPSKAVAEGLRAQYMVAVDAQLRLMRGVDEGTKSQLMSYYMDRFDASAKNVLQASAYGEVSVDENGVHSLTTGLDEAPAGGKE